MLTPLITVACYVRDVYSACNSVVSDNVVQTTPVICEYAFCVVLSLYGCVVTARSYTHSDCLCPSVRLSPVQDGWSNVLSAVCLIVFVNIVTQKNYMWIFFYKMWGIGTLLTEKEFIKFWKVRVRVTGECTVVKVCVMACK